jgi:alanine racemase
MAKGGMTAAKLIIDLDAIAANWRALNRLCRGKAAAVVKADAYGLGVGAVARALGAAGVRRFFVATAPEGATLRQHTGERADIFVLGGHMPDDTALIRDHRLCPADWKILAADPKIRDTLLVASHLACADEEGHAQNRAQLQEFCRMTDGLGLPRSLAATGGVLLGSDYHFDLTRTGIGLYGGAPFADARPVVRLSVPVIQVRDVEVGASVGYAASWVARRPTRIATCSAGYADGLPRSLSNHAVLWADDRPCPLVGRVSMDLITVDVTDLPEVPERLDILGPHQGIDALAEAAGTIGYEILTGLGARYQRSYTGGQ